MSAIVERLSSNRVKISFSIDPETFETHVAAAFRKNASRVNVPGFRRGKAPRKVVERYYGENVFFEDAFDELFPAAYQAALDENDLTPVDQPELDLGSMGGKDQPLEFTVEVFVSPEVTLGELAGLEVTQQSAEVTDEQVAQRLEASRERIARWVEVQRPVQNGDRATIDYLGSVDGVPFEGGKAEKTPLDIGSGTFIPGFEEQVIGMSVGEEKDISVSFPEDYRAENLAGKDAVFHIVLHEIKAKELPELDDEFAKDVSEFDTLDEYKADIRSKLEDSARSAAKMATDSQLIRAAVAVCEMDVPQPMVERQIDMILRDFQMRLAYQGISLDQFVQMTGQSAEQMREQYAADALERVKGELVLEAIRKREGFEPTEEQVEDEIARVAAEMGREIEDFKASMTERDWEYMREAAASEMAMEYLRKDAVFVPAQEEAQEAPAEEAPAKKPAAPRKKKAQAQDEAKTEE